MRRYGCLLGLALVVGCWSGAAPPKPHRAAAKAKSLAKGKRVPYGPNVWLEVLPNGGRQVVVAGEVVLRDGQLELFLTRKNAKEHEAVVAAEVDARKIHEALVAAEATAGEPVRFEPTFLPPKGTVIEVSVAYDEGGEAKWVRAQEWVRVKKTREALDAEWVFAGSVLAENLDDPKGPRHYLANDGGDLIAVVNLQTAVLDLTVQSVKRLEDRTYEAWTERIPEVGTKVEVILTPVLPGKK